MSNVAEQAGRGCARFIVDVGLGVLIFWVLRENDAPEWGLWATLFLYAAVVSAREIVTGRVDALTVNLTAWTVGLTVGLLDTIAKAGKNSRKEMDK